MRFLRPVYLSKVSKIGEQITVKQVRSIIDGISLETEDFNIENFPPGTGGEAALLRRFAADTGLATK